MKTRCACCASDNIRVCGDEDKKDYSEGTVVEHCYECNNCKYTGVLNVEDWDEML
jgi:hypothetical protein